MIKTLLLSGLIMAVTCTTPINAQAPETAWTHTFDGEHDRVAAGIVATLDGGYVTAGHLADLYTGISQQSDIMEGLLTKTDADGNVIWQKNYGGPGSDYFNAILATADGGFILAGTSDAAGGDVTLNQGLTDCWIVKTDSDGNIEWQRTYGGTATETADAITATADGGYVVGASTSSSDGDIATAPHAFSDFWIFKIDATGNIIWQQTLGGTTTDYVRAIKTTADGGFIAGGYSDSAPGGDVTASYGYGDFWIVKLSADGSLLWQKSVGGIYDDLLFDVTETSDGSILAAGQTESDNLAGFYGSLDYFVVKLDASGNFIWQKLLGGTEVERATSIFETTDGNYVTGGFSASIIGEEGYAGSYDLWVVKMDTAGNQLWQTKIVADWDQQITSVIPAPDGGIVAAGGSYLPAAVNPNQVDGQHQWIAKLAPEAAATASNNATAMLLYPNPAAGTFTIQTQQNSTMQLQLFTVLGQKVYDKTVSANSPVDVQALPAGIYMARMQSGKNTYTQKLIIK